MGASIPVISSFAQGATSLIGASSQASSIRSESRFEAAEIESRRRFDLRALKSSAKLRERRIAEVIKSGKMVAHNRRRMRRRLVAQQRLGFAGQGIEVSSGSAAAVIGDTLSASAADIATIRINALRQALGMKLVGIEEELRTRVGLDRLALSGNVRRLQATQRSRMTLLRGGLEALGSFGEAATILGKKRKKRTPRTPPISGDLLLSPKPRNNLPYFPTRGLA